MNTKEMNKTKLKTIVLKNRTFVRPSHALGTCGFNPKGWQIAPLKAGQSAITAFLKVNPNWAIGEVTQ